MNDKRSCFSCKHFKVCFVRNVVHEATRKVKMNIDGDAAPGKWVDIFIAIGNCCLDYKNDEK